MNKKILITILLLSILFIGFVNIVDANYLKDGMKKNMRNVSVHRLGNISRFIFNYPVKKYILKHNNEIEIGFSEQEIIERFPERTFVVEGSTIIRTPSYLDLIIAIQKLNSRMKKLRDDVTLLEEENELIKQSLCDLGETEWC